MMWTRRKRLGSRCVVRYGVMVSCVVIMMMMINPYNHHHNQQTLVQPKGARQSMEVHADNFMVATQSTNQKVTSLTDAPSEDSYEGLVHDDPKLVSYVRSRMLPPSSLPYNLSVLNTIDYSQFGQSTLADQTFLKGMVNGFYVEVGAHNGEYLSNTLFFEKSRDWNGLLIEPNPIIYSDLVSRHRKAHLIESGLAFTIYAGNAQFKMADALGHVVSKGGVKIKMFPLYTLLLALNTTMVDFFILDIEGGEMKVLHYLPWDKIRFRLMCIEVNHVPGGVQGMIRFLEPLGYTFLAIQGVDAWFGLRELLNENMDVDKYLKDQNVRTLRHNILHHKF